MALELAAEKDSLRQKTLEVAKRHKASWVELGQHLYAIYHDKLYKAWGFLSFEAYAWKELRLRQTTAMKLLKSYYFLEKEEPGFLAQASSKEKAPAEIPGYESVNLLRLARQNKGVTERDYEKLRQSVMEKASEPQVVRVELKQVTAQREEERNPGEVRSTRRNAAIKRLVTFLSNAKRQLEHDHLLPEYLLKQMEALAKKLEDQLEL